MAGGRRYYTTAQLSERISRTPEGFLMCRDVPIARTGQLVYRPTETPVQGTGDRVVLYRLADDLFHPDTMASFEGKPVTVGHPDDFVDANTWRQLAVGHVQHVRPGEGDQADKLMADLLITDAEAIQAVESGQLREISLGYESEHTPVAQGVGRQRDIIGNHVALVEAGRCGPECRIYDSAPGGNMAKTTEKTRWQRLVDFMSTLDEEPGKAKGKDEGEDPDQAAMLDALMKRMDAIEGVISKLAGSEDPAGDEDPEGPPADPEAGDEEDPEGMGGEEEPLPAAAPDDVAAKLDVLISAVMKLAKSTGLTDGKPGGSANRGTDTKPAVDDETFARAEILAPGIARTKDCARKALETFAATDEGAEVVRSITGDAKIDEGNAGTFLRAVAAVVAVQRGTETTDRQTQDAPSDVDLLAEHRKRWGRAA